MWQDVLEHVERGLKSNYGLHCCTRFRSFLRSKEKKDFMCFLPFFQFTPTTHIAGGFWNGMFLGLMIGCDGMRCRVMTFSRYKFYHQRMPAWLIRKIADHSRFKFSKCTGYSGSVYKVRGLWVPIWIRDDAGRLFLSWEFLK